MKAIILTMSTGNGHNIASNAIKRYLKAQGEEAIVIDAYKYFNKALSKLFEKGYHIGTKYIPHMYGKFYDSIEKHNPDSKLSWSKFSNSFVSRQFARYISKQEPDVVISTHPLAAVLMTTYKEKKLVNTKTIGVVTDFCILPYWDMADMDFYTTANELIKNQLIKKGIPEEKIVPLGIPIDMKFSDSKDKSQARKELGIEDKTTIFIMTGSMGFGNTENYILSLDGMKDDFQIISVCGNNKHMKNRIDLLNTRKKIYNYGFVTNVETMMDASDFIITKPGGLSVSEALAKNLPMILVNPIPGQEDRNKEFLINCGVAVGASRISPVDEVMFHLINCPERCDQIRKMQLELRKPNAAKDLGDLATKLAKER